MSKPEQFETFEDAYSVCREHDRPILVQVGDEIGTVYPSGHWRPTKAVQS